MYRQSDEDVKVLSVWLLMIVLDLVVALATPEGILGMFYLGVTVVCAMLFLGLCKLVLAVAANLYLMGSHLSHYIFALDAPVPWQVGTTNLPYALAGDFYYGLIIFPLQCLVWVFWHGGWLLGILMIGVVIFYVLMLQEVMIRLFKQHALNMFVLPAVLSLVWYLGMGLWLVRR